MAQRQRHRGMHPEDERLFSGKWIPILREGVRDLSFLLTRAYARDAALKIVGDHYQLSVRQRRALLRGACSDQSLTRRKAHEVREEALRGVEVVIDGYNLLIIMESALSGGVLLQGRDGCIRDMASVHGSYRQVSETMDALRCIGETLQALGVSHAQWYFDAPVSNSGRLKTAMNALAAEENWPWEVELTNRVDHVVAESPDIVITADGWILDRAQRWFNLLAHLLEARKIQRDVIDLGS